MKIQASNSSFEEIPVAQTAFYDLGFDPDFSVDGNVFRKHSLHQEQPSSTFFHSLIKSVYNMIKSFLQTPTEKAFQKLIQIDKTWQKAAQAEGMLYPVNTQNINKAFWQIKAPYICDLQEYLFFKQLSEVAKLNKINTGVYSHELLKPLHSFNRPQVPSSQSKKHILEQRNEEIHNVDVARLSKWGFILLGNHTRNTRISHKTFLEAINVPGDELKNAIRSLRLALREKDYKKFNERLEEFSCRWNTYIASHDLLKQLSEVYSQEDFFAKGHHLMENLYQKMQNPNVYCREDFLTIASDGFKEISNQREEESKKLYLVFSSRFPNSSTRAEWEAGS